MRFLIINHDYRSFQEWFYSSIEGVESKDYDELLRLRHKSLFGLAGFYCQTLRKLGHTAWDVRFNDRILQGAWARQHGVVVSAEQTTPRRVQMLDRLRPMAAHPALDPIKKKLRPIIRRLSNDRSTYEILAAQIRHYKPDVILNQAVDGLADDFLAQMRPLVPLIIGQIAAPIPEAQTFRAYDLMISSLPNFVNYFRRQGIASELNRLAFEPQVLEMLGEGSVRYDATFVGSFTTDHPKRVELLEYLCKSGAIEVWGENFRNLSKTSAVYRRYRGRALGIEMYRILRDSRITLNHHIGIAENYANNMRLFEATGVGTMLLTDHKENLGEMFVIDKEVVTYRTAEECREKVVYYLNHDEKRKAIAHAGQQRTLSDHTYQQRIEELLDIMGPYFRSSSRRTDVCK